MNLHRAKAVAAEDNLSLPATRLSPAGLLPRYRLLLAAEGVLAVIKSDRLLRGGPSRSMFTVNREGHSCRSRAQMGLLVSSSWRKCRRDDQPVAVVPIRRRSPETRANRARQFSSSRRRRLPSSRASRTRGCTRSRPIKQRDRDELSATNQKDPATVTNVSRQCGVLNEVIKSEFVMVSRSRTESEYRRHSVKAGRSPHGREI